MSSKQQNRIRRRLRIRAKISGTATRPRLTVFRSNRYLHLQLIDDGKGKTLAASSTLKKQDAARELSSQAAKLGITAIVFDRAGYRYHGKVAKLAEELRKSGLKF